MTWKTHDAESVDVAIDYPGGLWETDDPANGSTMIPYTCPKANNPYNPKKVYVIAKDLPSGDRSTRYVSITITGT